ncbi:hypothetical protein B0O80DRAFT_449045 [Mortierella sp. GBAus27b]|nr:hypothetical protein B0O80DRAFT_449045 [Mortierella sp. GBAus27b]
MCSIRTLRSYVSCSCRLLLFLLLVTAAFASDSESSFVQMTKTPRSTSPPALIGSGTLHSSFTEGCLESSLQTRGRSS